MLSIEARNAVFNYKVLAIKYADALNAAMGNTGAPNVEQTRAIFNELTEAAQKAEQLGGFDLPVVLDLFQSTLN
jgi:hypothetical protein